MRIELKKFGTTLVSRQTGKEALAAFQPTLQTVNPHEIVDVDFSEVITFSPSWGDEFLTPLLHQFGSRLILLPTDNLSVKATLDILEQASGLQFNRSSAEVGAEGREDDQPAGQGQHGGADKSYANQKSP